MKAKFCIDGKFLLYRYLKKKSIPFKKCGKIIFCNDLNDEEKLQSLYKNAKEREIKVQHCNEKKLNQIREVADAKAAIEVFDTGIFDSHTFFLNLAADIENNGGLISLNANVLALDKVNQKMHTLCCQFHQKFTVRSDHVLNVTGSGALDFLKAGFKEKYSLYESYFVKGHYFSYRKSQKQSKLFYPLPNELGLGVHLTIDLAGNVRFGPDTKPVFCANNFSQEVSDEAFYAKVVQNFPFVKKADISFSYAGIRPKLKFEGRICDDFKIFKDFEGGLISAIGIESPGLTASLAIGAHISEVLNC